jgi:hypothetical protein
VRTWLAAAGVPIEEGPEAEERFEDLRRLYGPYLSSLSEYLLMPLPAWLPPEKARYNWRTAVFSTSVHDGEN